MFVINTLNVFQTYFDIIAFKERQLRVMCVTPSIFEQRNL